MAFKMSPIVRGLEPWIQIWPIDYILFRSARRSRSSERGDPGGRDERRLQGSQRNGSCCQVLVIFQHIFSDYLTHRVLCPSFGHPALSSDIFPSSLKFATIVNGLSLQLFQLFNDDFCLQHTYSIYKLRIGLSEHAIVRNLICNVQVCVQKTARTAS